MTNNHQPPLGCDPGVFFYIMKKGIVLVDGFNLYHSINSLWAAIKRFFYITKKGIVLVDGFNLYHSITDLEHKEEIKAKWLDINSLCNSYLYILAELLGNKTEIKEIYFFTAFPYHRLLKDPDIIKRQKKYLRCLEDTGIQIIYGRFKSKRSFCPKCKKGTKKPEEKETDVAISIKLFELLHNNKGDIFLIITGDTDISPAIKTCQSLFPLKTIIFAFPYNRKNNELAKLAPGSFTIGSKQYSSHLFNDPNTLSNGIEISKPDTW